MTDQTTTPAAAPVPAPTPTPAEAAARIATLKAEKDFVSRWAAGDANARQELARLHEIAGAGEQINLSGDGAAAPAAAAPSPTDRDAALARIGALRKDPTWVAKWTAGDSEARAELAKLHEVAYADAYTVDTDVRDAPHEPTLDEIDRAYPAAKASDYTMPALVDEAGNHGPLETKADLFIRETMAAAGFPRENGSSLAREAARIEAKTRGFTQSQLDNYIVDQHAALERLWGKNTDANINLARKLIHELEEQRPGVKALLDSMPAVQNSATFVAAIYGQARVLLDRADARERANNRKGKE